MANDTSAAKFLLWARKIASDSDSLGIALRASVGVPFTTRPQVRLVTDETVCHRASLAADSSGNMPAPTNGRVHVAQIGTGYYAVHRVGWSSGEWEMVFFFDSTFAPRSKSVMY